MRPKLHVCVDNLLSMPYLNALLFCRLVTGAADAGKASQLTLADKTDYEHNADVASREPRQDLRGCPGGPGGRFDARLQTIVGLIGPQQCEQTTTFNMIAGAEKPTEGRVWFDGTEITEQPTDQLYDRGIVRTFKLSHEYGKMTALENLMVAGANQPGESIFMNWIAPVLCAGASAKSMSAPKRRWRLRA